MRVRGSPRNGEAAMFPTSRAVWTCTHCPVASGLSGVSAMDKMSQFRGYSACIPYTTPVNLCRDSQSLVGSTVIHSAPGLNPSRFTELQKPYFCLDWS